MFLFIILFVVVSALTVIVAYIIDRDVLKPEQGGAVANPMPGIMPVVAAPAVPPQETVCLNLTADADGVYAQSSLDKLHPCTNSCNECTTYPVNIPLECKAPTEEQARVQAALGNAATTYCLPVSNSCFPTLQACTHNAQCASCTDDDLMKCTVTTDRQTLVTRDGINVDIPPGQWCLPAGPQTCDPANGAWQWTTDGWKCVCYQPSIWGGDACDMMIACNNHLAVDETKQKQQLLLNTTNGGQWTVESGVNPEGCYLNVWGNDVSCDTPGARPNTVCQCDGLLRNSYTGFTNDPTNPLVCVPDNCSVNAQGGATSGVAVQWSDTAPPNPCVCSGANSSPWEFKNGKPQYIGWCSERVPLTNNAVVRIPPGNHARCGIPSNSAADITSLVPGFADDDSGTATVPVCSMDPCRGLYNDPLYRPITELQSLGHYKNNACACIEGNEARTVENCDYTLNPVCSTCVNPCAYMSRDNPDERPCIAEPRGNALAGDEVACMAVGGKPMCVCRADYALAADGRTCVRKFGKIESCKGYIYEHVCEEPGARCNPHMDCLYKHAFAKCTTAYQNENKCNLPGQTCGGSACPVIEGVI